jgi:hypothetical protein
MKGRRKKRKKKGERGREEVERRGKGDEKIEKE